MRTELLVQSNAHEVFELLTSRAAEVCFPPTPLEVAASNDPAETPSARLVDTHRFGIRVEVPANALVEPSSSSGSGIKPGPSISVRTLAPSSVQYLSEGNQQQYGELPFSPVVRVDYPFEAFEGETPELDITRGANFKNPLRLIMPHCFDEHNGEESCVMLGAPHGATQWELIHVVDDSGDLERDDLSLRPGEMNVMIPYAGIFCAFSSPDVEDIIVARFLIFAAPEKLRGDPTSLRVHLCPHLPDRMQEVEFHESSEWGLSECLGGSPLLHIYQGARFQLSFLGQLAEFTFMGVRESAEFTIPPTGADGELALDGDEDQREIYCGAVGVEVLQGTGRRAANIKAVAKQAGIPPSGYTVPFATRLRAEVRPNRPALKLRDRTPYDFTVTWQAPIELDGDGDGDFAHITHYSIELATSAPSGAYYPWKELWCGAGHATPDFKALHRKGGGGNAASRNLAADPEAAHSEVFSYTLEVDPALFGKLRMRCWAEGENRPSLYSEDLVLPRWKGKTDGAVDSERAHILNAMTKYFRGLTQHVTCGKVCTATQARALQRHASRDLCLSRLASRRASHALAS